MVLTKAKPSLANGASSKGKAEELASLIETLITSKNDSADDNINALYSKCHGFIINYIMINYVDNQGVLEPSFAKLYHTLSKRNTMAMLLSANLAEVKADLERNKHFVSVLFMLRDMIMHNIPSDDLFNKLLAHLAWSSTLSLTTNSEINRDVVDRLPSREEALETLVDNPWLLVVYIISTIDLSTRGVVIKVTDHGKL